MINSCPGRFWIFLILLTVAKGQNVGTFWHISDHHLDPYYSDDTTDRTKVCPSSYNHPVTSAAGPFGDYRCDSPWKLINSSVHAMKIYKADPDFIIWTGDDTLHTSEQDKYLGEKKVVEIIGNITMLLKDVFPDTKFYAAPGNHDYHPKSQIPPGNSTILSAMADMWQDWMTTEAYISFNANGYYTETFGDQNQHLLISLNSNLWYTSNKVVSGSGDPGGQFKWMEDTLKVAKEQSKKVFIIGHVPPGYFELVDYKYWYYPDYSERFNNIVTSYADIIAGQFFGHHHSDTFRLFHDSNGNTVSSMLLTPGVTPWMTTLPGADNGANNPGVRLYQYDRATLALRDFTQYYVDLESANKQPTEETTPWKIEYQATTAYDIPDVGTASLDALAKTMREGCEGDSGCPVVFEKYFLHNSVSYNTNTCNVTCQRDQLCAIMEVDYTRHENCISKWGSAATNITPNFLSLLAAYILSLLIS